MNSEELLRERINQIVTHDRLQLPTTIQHEIEHQIFTLFHQFANALENEKEEVYASGEARILRILNEIRKPLQIAEAEI